MRVLSSFCMDRMLGSQLILCWHTVIVPMLSIRKTEMSTARKLASDKISKAQCAQKRAYDKKSKEVDLKVGNRVMVLIPAEKQGKNWNLSRPFPGPYRVLQITPTNMEVRLVDRLTSESIFVALDRVRKCYLEQSNDTWTGYKHHRKTQGY